MTGLQALVALALFAPGVLAPKLGLGTAEIGLFTTATFAIGAFTSLQGGLWAARFGPFAVASGCALAVAAAMLTASLAAPVALVAAGLLLGLAFGPETPASSTLLARLARPSQMPLVFSIRQTGNQIGGMLGSLTLPFLALAAPAVGFLIIAAMALAAVGLFWLLRRRYDALGREATQPLDLPGALAMVRESGALKILAMASMAFAALQLGLNAFFVTFAVERLAVSHVAAGLLLATAQGGGLLGRLFWGWLAGRSGQGLRLIGALGFAMSACALAVSLCPPALPMPVLALLAFAFGFSASGWNGVFLAEVARLAPRQRVAEATGALLMASYTGLVISPILIAVTARIGTLSLSYAALAALALLATLPLLRLKP